METITARRLSLSGVLVLPVVLVAIGVWIVGSSRGLGVAWLVVSGALLVVASVQVVLPPQVVLGPAGLSVRTALRTRTYEWADCADFHLWERGRRSTVAFAYSGHEGGALSDSDARRARGDRALPVLAGVDGRDALARIEAYQRPR